MRTRIYLEDSEIALKCEEELNKKAISLGYSDWWNWYISEGRKKESLSNQYLMEVTKKGRKVTSDSQ